jgi:hypothetical protein
MGLGRLALGTRLGLMLTKRRILTINSASVVEYCGSDASGTMNAGIPSVRVCQHNIQDYFKSRISPCV